MAGGTRTGWMMILLLCWSAGLVSPLQVYSGRVAIIVDDLGARRQPSEALLSIDAPLTFSILPSRPWSRWIAEQVEAHGNELMLHLPMEAHSPVKHHPEDLEISMNMSDAQIVETIEAALADVPGAVGVDHHQGSLLSEDRRRMRVVLSEIARRGLFYVDSLTTPRSVAYEVGSQLGIRITRNRLFLDNVRTVTAICQQIRELGDIALRNGSAIGIAHPYHVTIEALQQAVPELKARGIEVVPVSQLIPRGND